MNIVELEKLCSKLNLPLSYKIEKIQMQNNNNAQFYDLNVYVNNVLVGYAPIPIDEYPDLLTINPSHLAIILGSFNVLPSNSQSLN